MDRWVGKVAVVTGASAGIGAAISKDLVKAGLIVVGLARRKERVEELKADLAVELRSKLHAVKCDVSKDEEIAEAFEWIEKEVGAIHVLVNNAGIVCMGSSITGENSNESDMRNTLQTNLWGSIQCTRKAVALMKRKQVVGAHIFLINSIVGHKVLTLNDENNRPSNNVYPVSKFGITALSEILRQEFNADKLQYKITSISPGAVRTEIVPGEFFDKLESILQSEDVSNTVLFALSTPPHVQIAELTIKPVGEQF